MTRHRRLCYTIIYDPIGVLYGGFRIGSQLTKEEVRCMLLPHVRSFATGTIMRDEQGRMYIVRNLGDDSLAQVLVRYRGK